MHLSTVKFTDNSKSDLTNILLFHIYKQRIPENIAIEINDSISNKTSFLLSSFPYAGTVYGYKGTDEVRTIVTMHKYMIYYHYDEASDEVDVLHVFCTLMDDKFLRSRLLEEGIYAVR